MSQYNHNENQADKNSVHIRHHFYFWDSLNLSLLFIASSYTRARAVDTFKSGCHFAIGDFEMPLKLCTSVHY
jgi:hypothetical protein